MSTQQLNTQHGHPVDRLFPELDDAAAIASLLERLDSTPTALFASLLDAAGPLRRAAVPEADAITTRILDRAGADSPGADSRCFLPFFAHAAAPHLHRLLTAFEASPHVASADDLMLRCGRDLFDQLGGLALRPLVVLMRAMSEAGELIGDTPRSATSTSAGSPSAPSSKAGWPRSSRCSPRSCTGPQPAPSTSCWTCSTTSTGTGVACVTSASTRHLRSPGSPSPPPTGTGAAGPS